MHGASTSTRSKPPAGSVLVRPTSRPSAQNTSTGSPRTACSTSRARCGVTSTAVTWAPAPAASAPSSAALPPGPAHRSSQRSSRPVHGRGRERRRHELGALVLHVGPAARDRRDLARGTLGQVDRVRASTRRPGPPTSRGQLGRVDVRPGRAHRCTSRPLVVGGQRLRRLRPAGAPDRRPGSRRTPARSTADGRGPPRGGRPGRRPSVGATVSSQPARSRSETRRITALANPAAAGATEPHQVHRGRHRRVRRAPGCAAAGRRPGAARPGPAGRSGRPAGRPPRR